MDIYMDIYIWIVNDNHGYIYIKYIYILYYIYIFNIEYIYNIEYIHNIEYI